MPTELYFKIILIKFQLIGLGILKRKRALSEGTLPAIIIIHLSECLNARNLTVRSVTSVKVN